MNKTYPQSSIIEWYEYHPSTQRLEIKTKSGELWLFHQVSAQKIEEFEGSGSLGTFMQQHFLANKDKYRGEKESREKDLQG